MADFFQGTNVGGLGDFGFEILSFSQNHTLFIEEKI